MIVTVDDPSFTWIQNWLTLDGRIHKRIHQAKLNTLYQRRTRQPTKTSVVYPSWTIKDCQAELKPMVQDQVWLWHGWKWMGVTHLNSAFERKRVISADTVTYEIRRVVVAVFSP